MFDACKNNVIKQKQQKMNFIWLPTLKRCIMSNNNRWRRWWWWWWWSWDQSDLIIAYAMKSNKKKNNQQNSPFQLNHLTSIYFIAGHSKSHKMWKLLMQTIFWIDRFSIYGKIHFVFFIFYFFDKINSLRSKV